MPERWERGIRGFKDVPVPLDDISRKAEQRPPDREGVAPSRHRVVTVIAAFAIFALAASLFLVPAFRSSPPATSPTPRTGPVTIAPDEVCQVPTLDTSQVLLVGNETVAYPKSVLQGPGESASTINGRATDALRSYLASDRAVHAPSEGWRAIASTTDRVTFAAPWPSAAKEWWVVAFVRQGDGWRRVQEEIVDQEPTPAERGMHLSLRWTEDVTIRHGTWNDPLRLVNRGGSSWTDAGHAYWGLAHVFDATGDQLGTDVMTVVPVGAQDHTVSPGKSLALPLALGGAFPALDPGTYSVVACVPELGLASPVTTLRVEDDSRAPDAFAITHPSNGTSMLMQGGGRLAVRNGCLGFEVSGGKQFTYLVLPNGFATARRGTKTVLINPIGDAVASVGQPASFGGGSIPIDSPAMSGISIPDACSNGRYFLADGAN